METKLEELAEGKRIILDSSFFHSARGSIPELLYNSRWAEITPEIIGSTMEQINNLETLCWNGRKIEIIKESSVEIGEYLRLLNGHRKYFGRNDAKFLSEKSKREKRRFAKKNEKREEWIENDPQGFSEYCLLCDKVYELINRFSLVKVDRDSRLFRRLDGLTKKIDVIRGEEKIARGYRGFKTDYKNPLRIGDSLKTDQKIVVSAACLAYKSPVLILTRDQDIFLEIKGLLKTIGKINLHCSETEQIPVPENLITIYGVRLKDVDDTYSARPVVLNQQDTCQKRLVPELVEQSQNSDFNKGILWN